MIVVVLSMGDYHNPTTGNTPSLGYHALSQSQYVLNEEDDSHTAWWFGT